jgi:hypothetical protein
VDLALQPKDQAFEDGELKLVDDERPPPTIVSVVTRR